MSDLPPLLAQILAALPTVIAIIAIAVLVSFLYGRILAFVADKAHLDTGPARRFGRWIITIICVVLVMGSFGFNLGGVWGVVSTVMAMVAIGFVAVWSVLSNILCTFLILLFRPYAIGDDIEFAGDPVRGRVVNLNFFYTTLVNEEGFYLQIPNNLFFQKVLKRRRGTMRISLATQLNEREHAKVPLPTAPTPPATTEAPKA